VLFKTGRSPAHDVPRIIPRRGKWFAVLIFVCAIGLELIERAAAQGFPSRPITVIVPFPAGGPTDTLARNLAEPMRISLGQPLVIENVGGAGGSIGVARVARAAPDGYTVGIGDWNSHVGAGAISPVPYDPLSDLEPISLLPSNPQLIVARSTIPAMNLQELIAWLRANPDKASSPIAGRGSAAHLCGVYFQSATGTRFQFVSYRGGAPAMQDLVAGHVDLMCAEGSQTLPHLRSGKLRAFAVTSQNRWFVTPEVPTIDQAGVPGLHISYWRGLWAPKATPPNLIARLQSAVVDSLADSALQQRLRELGQQMPPREQQTPQALGMHHKAEIQKWWPIIKAVKITAE
jgi:tripartite-type tricarboxylate transporter receptor subunit TctC